MIKQLVEKIQEMEKNMYEIITEQSNIQLTNNNVQKFEIQYGAIAGLIQLWVTDETMVKIIIY